MINVRAIVFQGKRTAAKALATIDEQGFYGWIDDVSVISVGKLGFTRVESTWAQDDKIVEAEAGWGALTCGLVGALFGPGGALAGTLGGGAIGGLVGGAFNSEIADPRLDEFASQMKKDTSALVLVADEPTLAEFVTATEGFDGEIIETELDAKDVKEIRKALKQKGQMA